MNTVESVKSYIEANKEKIPFGKVQLKNVKQLSGGFSNFVYRLEFEDNTTSIFKHFTSYFPIDHSLKLSTSLYFVEKVKIFENFRTIDLKKIRSTFKNRRVLF